MKKCSVLGCANDHYSKGICLMHYSRLRRHGSLELPPRKPNPNASGNRNKGSSHNRFTHGMTRTRTYKSWSGMKRRCFNPDSDDYKNYGARGITVCERWMDFAKFYEDMGECPKGMTIDRVDTDGDYEPGNCRWADKATQSRNRRSVKLNFEKAAAIREARSQGRPLASIAKEYGVHVSVVVKVVRGEAWVPSPDTLNSHRAENAA